jgi:hypothetical protein
VARSDRLQHSLGRIDLRYHWFCQLHGHRAESLSAHISGVRVLKPRSAHSHPWTTC